MKDYTKQLYRGYHIIYWKKALIEPKFVISNGHSHLAGFRDIEGAQRFINWMYNQGLAIKPVIEAKKHKKYGNKKGKYNPGYRGGTRAVSGVPVRGLWQGY